MESYKLIKENGDELEFNLGKYEITSINGMGNPQISYSTQNTFFQDGETVTNFVASPRLLNLNIFGKPDELDYPQRLSYWELREEILRFLSPTVGKLTFRFIRDDHVSYDLTNVFPTNGLTLNQNTYNESRNDGSIQEAINLTAYDPIWRKTNIISTGALTASENNELVFPITFPIMFSLDGIFFTTNLTYNGTWKSYPRITLTGPYNSCTIVNNNTGVQIQLIGAIGTGEQRILDLTNPLDGFLVEDSFGNSKWGEVNIGSNFTQFFFSPESDDNNIEVSMLGGSSVDSGVTVEYYEKYLGI